MYQLNAFVVLFSAWAAVAVNGYRCGDDGDSDYFCDKKLNEIHIVMTHNSLSYLVGAARNQNHSPVNQFRNGVRGFNFDLYPTDRSETKIWTRHGWGGGLQSHNPTDEIQELIAELNLKKNRDEIIVVQLQNGLDGHRIGTAGIDYLVNLFGTLLIEKKEDYIDSEDLGVAIQDNQRVYLVTNEEADEGKNFFRSADVIGENRYQWEKCFKRRSNDRKEMPLVCRNDPTPQCRGNDAMLLMNHFCGRPNYANQKCRILWNAQRMHGSSTFRPSRYPNIINVDFYDKGDVIGAQQCLRDGNIGGNGCETCEKMDY